MYLEYTELYIFFENLHILNLLSFVNSMKKLCTMNIQNCVHSMKIVYIL